MEKKYILTEETKEVGGRILHRIQAVRDFDAVQKGDLGGWVESEENLSHDGNCWVFGDGRVFGNGKIFDNGRVFGDGEVFGNARIGVNAYISSPRSYFVQGPIGSRDEMCIRDRTYTGNLSLIRNHILPHLGSKPIQKVCRRDIDLLYDKLSRTPKGAFKNGVRVIPEEQYKGLSPDKYLSTTTIKEVHDILKPFFRKAVEYKLIRENPVPTEGPKKRDDFERTIWDEELMADALVKLESQPLLHLAIHCAFVGSLRNGEDMACLLYTSCLTAFISYSSFLKMGKKIKSHFLSATFSHTTGVFPKRSHSLGRYRDAVPVIGSDYPY